MRKLIGIIVVSLLYVIVANAQSQQPTPSLGELSKPIQTYTTNKQRSPKNDQGGTVQSPLIVKTINSPKTQTEADQDRKEREEKAANDQHLVWFTGLLVLFTAVLAGVAMWQGWFAKKTLTATQRAFVFIEDISTETPPFASPTRKPKCKIIVTLKNSGLTPTKHMICNINYASLDKTELITTFPDGQEMIYGIIGPKASFRDLSVDVPIYDLMPPALSEERVYIWGWVDYNDIFSKHRHRTEFCYEAVPKGSDVGFRLCDKYNGADDECYRKPSPYTPPT
jgi:hypothetical protein